MTEIGVYELKTRISAVIRAVQAGERFIVTRRGKPVCALVPVPEDGVEPGSGEAWDSFWR